MIWAYTDIRLIVKTTEQSVRNGYIYILDIQCSYLLFCTKQTDVLDTIMHKNISQVHLVYLYIHILFAHLYLDIFIKSFY